MRYERKDRYYLKAKKEGRASRAYYKLEQMQQKFTLLKSGDRVLDLGCSPGGWLEVASKIVGKDGKVFGVDLQEVKTSKCPNVFCHKGDVNDDSLIDKIRGEAGKIDVVLSDMAPSTSGVKFRDSYVSYELAARALAVAKKVLCPGGRFVVKIFPGEEFAGFKKELHKSFDKVTQFRPFATRDTSVEIYLVGVGFRGI